MSPDKLCALFQRRLRGRRKQLGWTQGDLGDEMGISIQQVSDYECGRKSPTIGTLGRFATALSCNPAELVDVANTKKTKGNGNA